MSQTATAAGDVGPRRGSDSGFRNHHPDPGGPDPGGRRPLWRERRPPRSAADYRGVEVLIVVRPSGDRRRGLGDHLRDRRRRGLCQDSRSSPATWSSGWPVCWPGAGRLVVLALAASCRSPSCGLEDSAPAVRRRRDRGRGPGHERRRVGTLGRGLQPDGLRHPPEDGGSREDRAGASRASAASSSDGAPTAAIRFMNDFGLELFGFTEEELVGQPLVGTIVPESDEVEAEHPHHDGGDRRPTRKSTRPTRPKTRRRTASGSGWRGATRRFCGRTDRLQEILTIGIDITERRKIEQEISRSEADAGKHPRIADPSLLRDRCRRLLDQDCQFGGPGPRALPGDATCHALTHKS